MKFSVITVNYNNKDGLQRTIESVINQTFRDYEFIVIDGGSSDGSIDILNKYDEYITYWVSEPDGGIYQGMNKGIKKAKGEYLNFMNSGDCFFNENVLKNVANYNCDADIITGRDYHYSEEKKLGHASIQPPRISMLTFFTSTIDHQSSFIKHDLFIGSLYREDLRLVSDWVFFLEKLAIEGKKIHFIHDIVCYREIAGITWRQYDQNLVERENYLRQLLPIGVYQDYSTLINLDKESLFRLFALLDSPKARKVLALCIKIIYNIKKHLKS